jgi:hypothetical protein
VIGGIALSGALGVEGATEIGALGFSCGCAGGGVAGVGAVGWTGAGVGVSGVSISKMLPPPIADAPAGELGALGVLGVSGVSISNRLPISVPAPLDAGALGAGVGSALTGAGLADAGALGAEGVGVGVGLDEYLGGVVSTTMLKNLRTSGVIPSVLSTWIMRLNESIVVIHFALSVVVLLMVRVSYKNPRHLISCSLHAAAFFVFAYSLAAENATLKGGCIAIIFP